MTNRIVSWRGWYHLPFACGLAVLVYRLQPINGWLGHDYYHAFVRLLIGAAHFWQDPFSLPHYTPSLCGGIPFFADPQSTYFSLPQWLTFVMDPLSATYISIGLSYGIGYLGFARLFRDIFGYGARLSYAVSLLFVLNGFAFAHLFVGHLTHHSYLWFPALLYFFLLPIPGRGETAKAAAWFSLLLSYLFFSGGFHMLVVFFILCVLLAPYRLYLASERGETKWLTILVLITSVILLMVCSGKLAASALFSKNFVKGAIDRSDLPILSLLRQYFWFMPNETPLFIRFGRIAFGPWEFVGFFSKLGIPFTLLGIGLFLRRWDRRKLWLVLSYAALVPFICALASGAGGNESLPFFNVYHNPIKILGAFLPIFTMLTGYAFHRLSPSIKFSGERWRLAVHLLFAACVITEFAYYSKFFITNPLATGYQHDPKLYRDLKSQAGISPVRELVSEHGADLSGLRRGCSSLKCYEPLFGYRSEKVHSQLQLGASSQVVDGKFNMNHPGCFLYPEYFNCRPWDRIPADEGADFRAFVEGRSPDWGVPPWQSWLLAVNGLSLALLVFFCFGPRIRAGTLRAVIGQRTVEA